MARPPSRGAAIASCSTLRSHCKLLRLPLLLCWTAVLLVGYGTDATTSTPYFLLKNSWGTGWGDDGYMKIKRGVNMCGLVSSNPVYPTDVTSLLSPASPMPPLPPQPPPLPPSPPPDGASALLNANVVGCIASLLTLIVTLCAPHGPRDAPHGPRSARLHVCTPARALRTDDRCTGCAAATPPSARAADRSPSPSYSRSRSDCSPPTPHAPSRAPPTSPPSSQPPRSPRGHGRSRGSAT
jgi:hypothetical protein